MDVIIDEKEMMRTITTFTQRRNIKERNHRKFKYLYNNNNNNVCRMLLSLIIVMIYNIIIQEIKQEIQFCLKHLNVQIKKMVICVLEVNNILNVCECMRVCV